MSSGGIAIRSVPASRLLDVAYRHYDRLRRRASSEHLPALEIRSALLRICLGTFDADDLKRVDPQDVSAHVAAAGCEQHLLLALESRALPLDSRWAAYVQHLRHCCLSNAAQNLRFRVVLRRVAEVLQAVGADFMLIKGSALQLHHPQLIGRPQCDIDLLIRRGDLDRVSCALLEAGFAIDEDGWDVADYLAHHFHVRFARDGVVVEIHWDVATNTPPGFIDSAWSTREVIELDDMRWPVPSRIVSLIISCVHLSRHGFKVGMRWLGDIALELPRDDVDCREFERLASAWPRPTVHAPLWVLESSGLAVPESLSIHAPGDRLDNAIFGTLALRALFIDPDDLRKSQTVATIGHWMRSGTPLKFAFMRNAMGRIGQLAERALQALRRRKE